MGDGNFEVESVEILVVDDHSENLKTLSAVLNRDKYKVRLAQSGPQALRSVKTKPPNLILLDIRMPEMDGYEVCRRLKQDKISREIPIIFISALDEPMNKVKAFEVGGVDYIEKPFNSEEVIARINTHLKLRQLQKELQKHSQTLEKQVDVRTAQLVERTAELSKANQILSVIYDSVTDILFYISVEPDDCFRFLSINNAFLNATGLTRDQIVGKRIEEVIPETSVRLVLDNYKKSIKENRIVRWEETSVYPVGEKIGDVSIAPVLNEKGICTHLVGSVHDVTEHKQAEQALRETELRYRTVADYTYDWEYWVHIDRTLEYVSPSCERISGYTVQDFMETPSLFRELIVPEDRGIWDQHMHDSQRDLTLKEVQFRIKNKDGEIRWIEHACQPVIDDRGNLLGFRASNRDITIRKQSEAALMDSREKAQILGKKLLSAEETERTRLARELHDDIAQRLAFLNIEVDKLVMGKKSIPEPVRDGLKQISQGIGEVSSDINAISRRLHPAALDVLGLVRSIETECKNFIRLRETPITWDLDGSLQHLPKDISLCTFRILQEGMRNILRHAKATAVHVTLIKKNDSLHFLIKDDGVGFDPASNTKVAGLGIASMEERARLLKGDLSIESRPGQGTTVKLVLPLKSRNEV